ncbi:DUF4279 domain-containing protein [Desulforegula conservatrix]|uniref:DUF4279 domain-containing protein n=1 Tax=Desulforegula conservatrix TaxID=153026 RepID=UPI0004857F24|nr:DUF4279 domain-containing protein [Desulforegula conservatrix]
MLIEIMEQFTIRIAGFGLPDEFITDSLGLNALNVNRKGEIWNIRTGKCYEENIIFVKDKTTYESGFEEALDRLIVLFNSCPMISELFTKCSYKELQIWASMGDEKLVPSIHLSPEHVLFLSSINAHIDIDII